MFIVSLVCLLCRFLEYHNVQESIGWMSLHHSGCVACWLLWVCPWLPLVCGAASVRWLGLLTVSLRIWQCYSCTEDWGCHSPRRWFVRQSILPLVLRHSCYNVVRTLHWCICPLRLGIGWLYHILLAPPYSEPIHRCRHASWCLDTCRWSQLTSFSVCALGMLC